MKKKKKMSGIKKNNDSNTTQKNTGSMKISRTQNFVGQRDFKNREIIGQSHYGFGRDHHHYVLYVVSFEENLEPLYVEQWENVDGSKNLEKVCLVFNFNHPWYKTYFKSCEGGKSIGQYLMSSIAMAIQSISIMGPRIGVSEENIQKIIHQFFLSFAFTLQNV